MSAAAAAAAAGDPRRAGRGDGASTALPGGQRAYIAGAAFAGSSAGKTFVVNIKEKQNKLIDEFGGKGLGKKQWAQFEATKTL